MFYGFYRLWLRNETFHHLNRTYLVGSATLSFFIPVLHSDWVRAWFVTQEVSQTLYTYYNPQSLIIRAVQPQSPSFTWGHVCALIYICGIVFFVGRLTFKMAHLERFLRRNKGKSTSKVAFSFFNFVAVSHDLDRRTTILAHEKAHVRQLHSADVLLFELIAIFNWFNPIVYAYQQSIRNIHEFLADDVASRYEASKADYALLLLSQQFGVQPVMLSNNFFDTISLKRRIQMLAKPQSNRRALLKYGFTVPIFVCMLVFSSAAVSEHRGIKTIEKVVNNPTPVFKGQDAVLELSNVMAMSTKMATSWTADSTPKKNVIEVRPDQLAVQNKPLVFVDGTKLSYRSINQILPENLASIKVVKDVPNGIKSLLGDKFRYGFSILSAQNEPIAKVSDTLNRNALKIVKSNSIAGMSGPVFLIDNTVVNEAEVSKMNPNDISRIDLFKGEAAQKMAGIYGVNAANGIVSITSKSQHTPEPQDEVFTVVEQSPEYQGGLPALYKFISDNLQYPASAVKNKIQGTVLLNFVVEKDGNISSINVIKSIDSQCDNEAVRVLKLMPKWNPGRQNGKPVRVSFTVPIEYKLK